MAGYEWLSRDTSKLLKTQWYIGGLPRPVGGYPLSNTQTTYSYRSGRDRSKEGSPQEFIENYHNYDSYNDKLSGSDYFRGPGDNGHSFYTAKRSTRLSHENVYWAGQPTGTAYTYRGPLSIVKNGEPTFRNPVPVGNTNYYGTLAIRNTKPTNPAANLSNLLGESIRELPSAIADLPKWAERMGSTRGAGSHYLALEFGWKPFVKEIVTILETMLDSQKTIRQYYRDSGPDKQVRRGFTFPTITTDPVSTTMSMASGGFRDNTFSSSGKYLVSNGTRTMIDSTETNIYFKGSYQYYVEQGKDLWSQAVGYEQLANKLLGTRITPSLLWELAPWSWLSDWNNNLGALLSNATSFQQDGLVLKYGYLMVHQRRTVRYVLRGNRYRNGIYDPGAITQTFVSETKERIRANPYGFDLNPSAYTEWQWSILIGLGLARGPNYRIIAT